MEGENITEIGQFAPWLDYLTRVLGDVYISYTKINKYFSEISALVNKVIQLTIVMYF